MNYHLSLGDLNKYVARRCAGSALFALTCLLMSGQLQAAGKCYKAISIDRKPLDPLCKAMEANLNEYCQQSPMVCDLQIHEKYRTQLTLPVWEEVTASTPIESLERLIKLPYLSNPNPDAASAIWTEVQPELYIAHVAGRLQIMRSNIDLFQSGVRQLVYKYTLNDCEVKNKFLHSRQSGGWDVALKTPTTAYAISEEGLAALKRKYQIVMPSGVGRGTLFQFGGKIFIYYMYGHSDSGTLETHNFAAIDSGEVKQIAGTAIVGKRNVCEITYKAQGEKQ